VALLLIGATVCGDDRGGGDSGAALDVVATTTVLSDFARVIGGERMAVQGILRPNVDAHDYEPSASDLDALSRVDVVVKNGVHLEEWFDDGMSATGSKAVVVDASTGITIRSPDDGGTEGDPHIWQNPRNAKLIVATMLAALVAADPPGASVYQANATRYTAARPPRR
jgi:ABC-type Zn uptake system ZnuABC Zn-binding protein ZnuA